jgi:UDP-N-acetylmuramate dehydrogenase
MAQPDPSILAQARDRLHAAGLTAESGVRLSDCGTFRLGGPCALHVACATPAALTDAVRALAGLELPRVIIGGGSNLLFSDAGFAGVVLQYRVDREDPADLREEDGLLVCSGAVPLDRLAAFATARGLEGLSALSGIPGTVGGAVAGNAGAWGEQIGDAVVDADLLDAAGNATRAEAADLDFAYRRSALQRDGRIVLRVRLRVRPGDAAALAARRAEILALRREKHPDLAEWPSIGSIFRNIEPTSAAGRRQAAGWFLEQAGAKDFAVGGARLFPRHANIIVAGPGCRAQEVRELIERMRGAVRGKFGMELVREVRYLGSFAGEAEQAGFY